MSDVSQIGRIYLPGMESEHVNTLMIDIFFWLEAECDTFDSKDLKGFENLSGLSTIHEGAMVKEEELKT